MMAGEMRRPVYMHTRLHRDNEAGGELQIHGFANVETKDRHGTRFNADGFDVSAFKRNPIGFFDHGWDPVIGGAPVVRWDPDSIDVLEGPDGRGLYMAGRVWEDTPEQQRVASYVRQGAVKFLSVGFRPLETSRQEDEDGSTVDVIERSELLEVSIATVPSNRESEMSIARALRLATDIVCPSCADRAEIVSLPNLRAALASVEAHAEELVRRGDRDAIELARARVQAVADMLRAEDELTDEEAARIAYEILRRAEDGAR